MDLYIRHQTTYRYATPATQVALLLRLLPGELDSQRVKTWQVSVNGRPVPTFLPNAFGDGEGFFQLRGSVTEVEILAEGVVETWDRNGMVSGFGAEPPHGVFLRQTRLTQPDSALRQLAEAVAHLDPIPRLHQLSSLVHDALAYAPGATSPATSAAEALALGRGVCQDHAQVFVGAARCLGIPARYVAGYLLADEAGHTLRETHAWAEAWVEGLGWIGFDATNRVCVTDQHVRLCAGLDAHDAAPVRGSAFNTSEIGIQAEVVIHPADRAPGQQAQQQQ